MPNELALVPTTSSSVTASATGIRFPVAVHQNPDARGGTPKMLPGKGFEDESALTHSFCVILSCLDIPSDVPPLVTAK